MEKQSPTIEPPTLSPEVFCESLQSKIDQILQQQKIQEKRLEDLTRCVDALLAFQLVTTPPSASPKEEIDPVDRTLSPEDYHFRYSYETVAESINSRDCAPKSLPKRIILVRHGQSEGNADSSIYEKKPDYLLQLTDLGRQQALEAGERIAALVGTEKIKAYVSPYSRTRQTFELIQSKLLPSCISKSVEEPRLREQDFGNFQNVNQMKEILQERENFGHFFYRFPMGESGADVFDRASTFLDSIYRAFSNPNFPQNVLLVSHGLFIRLFLMRWFKWTVEFFESLKNPANGHIVVMEFDLLSRRYFVTTPLYHWRPFPGASLTHCLAPMDNFRLSNQQADTHDNID